MQPTPTETTLTASTRQSSDRSALGLAVVVGLGVGALTSVGQAVLADAAGALANSAGPWALAAFLVARRCQRTTTAVIAAIMTMALSEVGYVIVSHLRDIPSSSSTIVFWMIAAVLAGVPIGVAGRWSRSSSDWRAAAGAGVIAGVLMGEGIYGADRLADTTNSTYWFVEVAIGVVLVAFVATRHRSAVAFTTLCAAAVATAAVVYLTATSF